VVRRRVTFKLDEEADVVARLRGPVRRRFELTGRVGSNVLTFPRLRPGRYGLAIRATDAAGNESLTAQVKFRIPKRKR
jgi:hypothetical protein